MTHSVVFMVLRNAVYDRISLIVAVMVGSFFSPQIAYDISTAISIPFFFVADSASGWSKPPLLPEVT